jgi:hypothetical protein
MNWALPPLASAHSIYPTATLISSPDAAKTHTHGPHNTGYSASVTDVNYFQEWFRQLILYAYRIKAYSMKIVGQPGRKFRQRSPQKTQYCYAKMASSPPVRANKMHAPKIATNAIRNGLIISSLHFWLQPHARAGRDYSINAISIYRHWLTHAWWWDFGAISLYWYSLIILIFSSIPAEFAGRRKRYILTRHWQSVSYFTPINAGLFTYFHTGL